MTTDTKPSPIAPGQPLTYRRRTGGQLGVGFIIHYAGRDMHSVAWEEGPATRHMEDELEALGIEYKTMGETTPDHDRIVDQPAIEDLSEAEAGDIVAELREQFPQLFETMVATPQQTIDPAGKTDDTDPQYKADPKATEAENIRGYLRLNIEATNQQTIAALHEQGIEISSSQVSAARKQVQEEIAKAKEEADAKAEKETD